MNPVEEYLSELKEIRSYRVAVEETSFYGKLETLLNEIGKTLKPKVRCIINPKNAGAGIPDGGLFTPDQRNTDMTEGQIPSRGVVEVKGILEEVEAIAGSEQVRKYLQGYGQVLVTNYRDFVLIGRDDRGEPKKLEDYRLADGVAAFRAKLAHPVTFAEEHEFELVEYLKRVMLRVTSISEPSRLASVLASYARQARHSVQRAKDLPALDAIRTALEEALGLKFEGEKGEHFFRSTLVQTLFYGVFSAWVLWHKENLPVKPDDKFQWKMAQWSLHVPMIRALFTQIATPAKLGDLGLVPVLDWAESALNRVDRLAFFEKFEEAHAVQYFYEPFLEAFDPELRKELGVWYTPPEIVEYMVERVDTVLRDELHIDLGLADSQVYVLDPACGTGAYLVQVLRRIERTLRKETREDAAVGADVKKAAMERVFGFEILPAPFVVAHLQLGLALKNLGAELSDQNDERAGVFLTNSLTGWEPPTEAAKKRIEQLAMSFPELKEERDAAEKVKQDTPILVILGNPPYNAFAGVSPEEEQGLVEPYKQGLSSEWGIRKFNLDDLYVRFFRMAERRIAEQTGRGIVCYISSFSYLRDPSFVVMRHRFLNEFESLWFDCMNGDSRETGKLTPDGKPDPSVFSTERNKEGIRIGTTICLMVRHSLSGEKPKVRFRQFWGATKRTDLLESLKVKEFDSQYEEAMPTRENRFSYRPLVSDADFLGWPRLIELCAEEPCQGLAEDRRKALIDTDSNALTTRMSAYFNVGIAWEDLKERGGPLVESYVDFPAENTRYKALQTERFRADNVRRYSMRPFDVQYCYYTSTRPIWRRHRPEFFRQAWQGNAFIASRFHRAKDIEGVPIAFVTGLCDYHFLTPNVGVIPLRIRRKQEDHGRPEQIAHEPLLAEESANLSRGARAYLTTLDIGDPDIDLQIGEVLWMHVLAMGYSPAYLSDNADGIGDDWPRIPLPAAKDVLLASAELGKQVAALLDTENAVARITAPTLRPEIMVMGVPSREGGGNLNPDTDFRVTAGWGHAGKDGATMPGQGRYGQRDYTAGERAAIEEGAAKLGLTPGEAFQQLGETTFDIYLNEIAYWRNVPNAVWNYHIGGYQVIKKWLSYREEKLLGRPLTLEEVREVSNMVRRITAIVLLQPALDRNYEAVKASTYPWPAA